MALSRDEAIAIGAGAVAAAGVFLLARRGPSEPGLAVAVTGPSERTGLALISAGVESQRISAALERDMYDIYASAFVDVTSIESRERVAVKTLETTERVRGQELTTQQKIAEIFSGTQKYLADARVSAIRAQNEPQQQKGIFDFILDIGQILLPFLF